MKAIDFADVITLHGLSIGAACGATSVRSQLDELAEVCQLAGNSTIASFARKIHKQLESVSIGSPKSDDQLAAQLHVLGDMLLSAKARAAANDAQLLSELVAGLRAYRSGSLVAALKQLSICQPSRPPAAKKVSKVDDRAVRSWADRLEAANPKPEKFKSLVKELKEDKSLNKAAIDKIAGIFVGVSLRYKSRAAAIKKIEERHYIDTLNESRGRIIDSVAI